MRIQRWLLSLQPFNFVVRHISAKVNLAADSLSRFPSSESVASNEAESSVETVCLVLRENPVTVEELVAATERDDDLMCVKKHILEGWTRKTAPNAFWPLRSELCISDMGLIMLGSRIVVPSAVQDRILRQTHEGHIGAAKMKALIRSMFFWTKMSSMIDEFVNKCENCLRMKPQSSAAPLKIVADEVETPWHTVAVDFTGNSVKMSHRLFFTVIDYFSRYPMVYEVKSSSSDEAVGCLSHLFSMFGIPKVLISDNGTAFTGYKFSEFMSKCGIVHKKSSPCYPQGNGVVERFHGTLKSRVERMISSGVEFDVALRQALMDIRSLPNVSTGCSPFSRLFGREMSTRFQKFQSQAISCRRQGLADIYKKREMRKRSKIVKFQKDERVVVLNHRSKKFEIPGKIIRKNGYGAWLVNMGGTKKVINQRFIRKDTRLDINVGPHDLPDPGWSADNGEGENDCTIDEGDAVEEGQRDTSGQRHIDNNYRGPYNLRNRRQHIFEHFYL